MSVRTRLEELGLSAKRQLGQSFLTDPNIIARIVRTATSGAEPTVVEIGPGLGALTQSLVGSGKQVVAIERDAGLARALREDFANRDNFEIIEADALDVTFGPRAGRKPAVVGNLPYSITTPLLLHLLAQRHSLGTTTVMIQKEVADRLLAAPGTREYGSLSVLFGLFADIKRVRDVSPGAFWPPPKVHSTVLSLQWLALPRVHVSSAALCEQVVRAAFGQRRKTLRNALAARYGRDCVHSAETVADLDFGRRAETLNIVEFGRLAASLDPAGRTA